jgi:hypothetical protein
LLLASERGTSAGVDKAGAAQGQAQNAASSGAVLKRLTIVAARPDATLVYLRADYATQADASPGNVVATLSRPGATLSQPSAALRPSALTHISGTSGSSQTQTQSRGVGLYARTQRILADLPETMHIDVHA